MRPLSPIRPTDDDARTLARSLLAQARHGALATLAPNGIPMVTRIALGTAPDGSLLTLLSGLAAHTTALRANPHAGLLIGDLGPKGDPLTHPRLSLQLRADPVEEATGLSERPPLRAHWLKTHPKSKLYIDLPDFRLFRLTPLTAALNAGFGRAYTLTAEDLCG